MPGPYSSLMVLRRRASPPPRRPPPGPRFGLCLGWRRGPMGGVMVVYGPPITYSLPPAIGASRTSQFMISSDSEIRLGDWQTFQKFGAAGARCVPTMVGRAAKKILRSRQPFLIGKWPLLGAIPLVGAQRSSQAGPAAFPSTYTFRMEAQTQRRAQTKCKSICTKVGRQCQNRRTENGV